MDRTIRTIGKSILFVSMIAAGCSSPSGPSPPGPPSGPSISPDEAAVREAFTAFQAALKVNDAATVWELLDSDSRADAERAAKALQAEYSKASPEDKAQREKELGLTAAELAALTGKGFVKSKRFIGKYDEVPDSKIKTVTVQGDKATVLYVEPDDDEVKLSAVRESGKWKLTVPMK